MDDEIETCRMRRIPGLFRRWEIAALLEAGEDYHLEDAGTSGDGCALLAVYRRTRDDAPEPGDAA